jgi:hypothetical protein
MSTLLNNQKLILTNNTSNQDGFDRLRTSRPNTLFEINATTGKLPYLVDEVVTGSAVSTANTNNSYIRMAVSTTGDKVVRQTCEYIPYQPGKSRMMLFSTVLEAKNGGSPGVICRVGCFDSSVEKTFSGAEAPGNGCFFQLDNKTLSAVIRLNNTDLMKDKLDWNYDNFNGNGPSGFTVNDFSKAVILAIDQEWLGVGTVRFGFFIKGKFRLGHVFNHSGIGLPISTGIKVPYTKTAKLPIRYEISTSSNVNAEMSMICSTVISEGGYEPKGIMFSVGKATELTISPYNIDPIGIRPIISIRLRQEEPYNRKTLILKTMTLYTSTVYPLQWDLYILPNSTKLTGADWKKNDINNSCAEYDRTATAVDLTGSLLLGSGYAIQQNTLIYNYDRYLASLLVNSTISGQSKVLSLVGRRLDNNHAVKMFGSLSWREIL